jgi:hypothetical protein
MQVYHQEGTTLGTDESPLKQELMKKNRLVFYNKWQTQLHGKQYTLRRRDSPTATMCPAIRI